MMVKSNWLLEKMICSCPITAEYDNVAPCMLAELCPAVTEQPSPFAAFPFDDASVLLLAVMGIQWSRTALIVDAVIRRSRVGGTKTSTCALTCGGFTIPVSQHSQQWRAFFTVGCSHETGVRSTTSRLKYWQNLTRLWLETVTGLD